MKRASAINIDRVGYLRDSLGSLTDTVVYGYANHGDVELFTQQHGIETPLASIGLDDFIAGRLERDEQNTLIDNDELNKLRACQDILDEAVTLIYRAAKQHLDRKLVDNSSWRYGKIVTTLKLLMEKLP